MGTTGYDRAGHVAYRTDEVILEVGSGASTRYLATVGPTVFTVDVDPTAHDALSDLPNVETLCGRAEAVLRGWRRPIGFAWLDGHDWPYVGNPPTYYVDQQDRYVRAGRPYSRDASRRSHLEIVRLIADHARVVAFDDTWRTHAFRSPGDACVETVPPATVPAPPLAMDRPIYRSTCGLELGHPHHGHPRRGWDGKGGTAIPYLLGRGFEVAEYGLGLAVLRRVDGGG